VCPSHLAAPELLVISIAMTRLALVVAAASLWLGVGLAAQQSGLSPLRASIERASTQRSGDWSAVQRLRPGTRVRVTARQGPATTGRVTAVSESSLHLGTQGSVRREDVSTVRLPHKRILEYVGLGLLFGGAGGLMIGAASDCDYCELRGLATMVGAVYGAAGGAFGGLMVGSTLNDRPERLVYAR